MRKCQNADGSVRYSLSLARTESSFSLTAAAASTLNALGVYRSKRADDDARVLRRALDYIRVEFGRRSRHPERSARPQFFFYGNLYAAQALYQENEAVWDEWYVRVRDAFLQAPLMVPAPGRGSRWRTPDGDSRYGDEYATAMALLILEVPLGYLPIFQR